MTKREHAALQNEINKMTEYMQKADEAFNRLQDLNGTEGTGRRWCCAEQNYKELLSVGKDYSHIYNDYIKYNSKLDALRELGSTLAELNFWN